MVDATDTEAPDVSVVIPAYNAMPYLVRCLESLVGQTIGHDRMEIVVVDDGSRDGTGEELDRWAAEHPHLFRVVHHPGSGGPATPRNTGLDLARGRYVYFVDADDYLGVEALERLVRTADEHGSDIVLGRMEGAGGRGVPRSMFRETDSDVDLFTSRIYWTLAPLKLFRREFVEKHALRFPTRFPNASDQPFTAQAYLRAGKISVNADYDYYFAVRRSDGQHVTSSGTFANRMDVVEWMCDLLAREVPDLERREHLLNRHFQIELRRTLTHIARSADPDDQRELLTRLAALVRTHLTPGLAQRLPTLLREALEAATDEQLEPVLRAQERLQISRTLRGWQHAWTGTDLTVTGRLGAETPEPAAFVVARPGKERLFPATVAGGTVTGTIPVADLASGTWTIRLRLGTASDHAGFAVTGPAESSTATWRTPLAASAILRKSRNGRAVLEVSLPSPRDIVVRRLRAVKRRIRR